MSRTALLITGGHTHPAADSVPALRSLLRARDIESVVTDDPEQSVEALSSDAHDLMVINTLRFSMAHERFDEFRDDWAFSLSSAARRALHDWVAAGNPLLVLHAALVSFDDWPAWADLIGGRWNWDRSSHPPLGPVAVTCAADGIARGLDAFEVVDECYTDLELRPGNDVVAHATVAGGSPQPAAWTRSVDGSRVAVSTLGHDLDSLDHPGHRALLGCLVDHVLEEDA